MTWEHLHLIAHSFPIVLTVSGTAVGLVGWALGREELERWALIALLVAGAFVIPAYLTGLAAADVVAERTFFRPGIVQTHRFAATWAAIPVVSAAVLAGIALKESDDRRLRRFVIVVGAVAAIAVSYAAWLGSRVEHGDEANPTPEAALGFESGSESPPARPPGPAPPTAAAGGRS